jgi:hypothetical protein
MEAFFGSDRQSQFWRAFLTRDQQNTSIRALEVSAQPYYCYCSLPINCQIQSTKDEALQLLLAVQVNVGWRELPDAGDRPWRKRRAARTVAVLRRLVPLSPSAAFRFLRRVRAFFSAAIIMRLLASTAVPTHSSNRSRPFARHRFIPRPRNNTEMRPSMPARKRWPSLNGRLFS